MSRFTGPVDLRHMGARWRRWELLAPLAYEAGAEGSGRWIIVPDGVVTDGASVPRWLWWALPATGRYLRAAVLHDWLYERLRLRTPDPQAPTRAAADMEFRIAMAACGVSAPVRWAMWAAVRLFGRV